MKKKLRKIWNWIDDRGGITEAIKPLAKHLVPPGTGWNYVWGSATLFCFTIQVITGIALAFLFQPSVDSAYESLQYIEHKAFLGHFIRGLHNWGASGMVVMMGIHMIRVYLNAVYKYPREMNWLTGVVLFGTTITLAFTGQLMRWDSNGVWTAILAAEQMGRIPWIGDYVSYFFLGGTTLSGETFNRFFALHVFVFPGIISLVVVFHLYLVIRNGISEPPKAGRLVDPKTYRDWYDKYLKEKGVPFFPDVIWRDVVFSFGLLLVLIGLAIWMGAPEIGKPPDPTILEVEPHPDWYFEWIYATFATMNRNLEPYYLFFAPLIVGVVLLSVPFIWNRGERSPRRRPWAVGIVVFMCTAVISLTILGLRAPWVPKYDADPLEYTNLSGNNEKVEKGIEVFNRMKCLACHKIGKHGGQSGPELTNVQQRMTREQLIIRIVNGTDDMPGFGGSLNSDELDALVEYLLVETKENGLLPPPPKKKEIIKKQAND